MTLFTFTLLPFASDCSDVLALGAEGASEPEAKRGEDVTGEPFRPERRCSGGAGDRAHVQAHELGQPDAGAEQHLEHHTVSLGRCPLPARELARHALSFRVREPGWRPPRGSTDVEATAGIVGTQTGVDQPAAEGAECGLQPVHGEVGAGLAVVPELDGVGRDEAVYPFAGE